MLLVGLWHLLFCFYRLNMECFTSLSSLLERIEELQTIHKAQYVRRTLTKGFGSDGKVLFGLSDISVLKFILVSVYIRFTCNYFYYYIITVFSRELFQFL